MPRDEIQAEMQQAWQDFTKSMEKSIDLLENDINEAKQMTSICTDEWCKATEHVIDDLANSLFSISEPRGGSEADSERIKTLKRRVHDLYANYREVYNKASA
jgi:hypothetical protein